MAHAQALNTSIDYPNFSFEITSQHEGARTGVLRTPHGAIETPNYIFCGTKGTIKSLSPAQVREAGADIILGNTYHLMIQPGSELIEKMGGIHKFGGWHGPMMTDSGGYQIFSLGSGTQAGAGELKGRNQEGRTPSLIKINEKGALFRSYTDGRKIMLRPEDSIAIQRQIGADLIYQLDEFAAAHTGKKYMEKAMHRSIRWGNRCLEEFERGHTGRQAMYGVVQGGVYPDLREQSVKAVNDQNFFGMAIGGSLGGDEMYETVSRTMGFIRKDRPVHLLGIGTFRDVFEGVRIGVDTFDCVIPTRLARHGVALMKGAKGERINLLNAKYREDPEPLAPELEIDASAYYSKAYIHHLFKANEIFGIQILSQHNIKVITTLMREVREAIKTGTLDEIEKAWLAS